MPANCYKLPVSHYSFHVNERDQRVNRLAHHLLEREGLVSNGQPITAAKIPEHGIGDHQPQSGRADPNDELRQNRRRRVCSTKKKSFDDLKEMQAELVRMLQEEVESD